MIKNKKKFGLKNHLRTNWKHHDRICKVKGKAETAFNHHRHGTLGKIKGDDRMGVRAKREIATNSKQDIKRSHSKNRQGKYEL